jgi:deferrochelatase/peroxidase EfeB
MLRRGYNYQDGVDALGRWDAGLFFLAYSRDPRTHVVPPMIELARHDVMNEYIRHTSSAVFAVPPGVRDERDWFGRALFES